MFYIILPHLTVFDWELQPHMQCRNSLSKIELRKSVFLKTIKAEKAGFQKSK